MSVHKPGKAWQVRLIRKGFPRIFKTFQYKAEAEACEAELLAEMKRGGFVSRTEAEGTTLRELLQRDLSSFLAAGLQSIIMSMASSLEGFVDFRLTK